MVPAPARKKEGQMKHGLYTQGTVDLITDAEFKQIPKQDGSFTETCTRRIGKINDYQGKVTQVTFKVEAFGEMAHRLAAIPTGNTVVLQGEFKNSSYQGQDGQQKWDTALKISSIGDCGPSQQPQPQQNPQYQGSGVAPNYNRAPQPGYGQAPAPQQSRNPHGAGGYAPPQQPRTYAPQAPQMPHTQAPYQQPAQQGGFAQPQRTVNAPAPQGMAADPRQRVDEYGNYTDVPF